MEPDAELIDALRERFSKEERERNSYDCLIDALSGLGKCPEVAPADKKTSAASVAAASVYTN